MIRASKLLAATALIASAVIGSANATVMTFGIANFAATSDTSNHIEAGTTSIGFGLSIVNTSGASAYNINNGSTFVTFAPSSVSTVVGVLGTPLVVTAGNVTFDFTSVASAQYQITPYVAAVGVTPATAGFLKETFIGTVTSDITGGGISVTGQTATMALTCNDNGSLSCSESVATPGDAALVPEPVSMSIVGFGLAGLAAVRRRRAAI